MEIVVLVVAVLAVVAGVAAWRRLGGSRSDAHSINKNQHALQVLGDVAAHSTAPAPTRHLGSEEIAKSHIRPTEDDAGAVLRPAHASEMPLARVRLEPPVPPGPGGETPSPEAPAWPAAPVSPLPPLPPLVNVLRKSGNVYEEAAPTGKIPVVAVELPAAPPGESVPAAVVVAAPAGAIAPPGLAGAIAPDNDSDLHVSRRRPRFVHLPGSARRRHLTTGVVGFAVVAAVGVTAILLAGGPPPRPTSSSGPTSTSVPTTTSAVPGAGRTTTTEAPTPTTSTLPSTIVPLTANLADVAYVAPAATYVIALSATDAPCWIGLEKVAGGPWFWEGTLQPGEQKTYDATGAVVVRVGAPRFLKIAINGITVQLPASNVQPYDLTFTPSA